jgi:hypothetical protein
MENTFGKMFPYHTPILKYLTVSTPPVFTFIRGFGVYEEGSPSLLARKFSLPSWQGARGWSHSSF